MVQRNPAFVTKTGIAVFDDGNNFRFAFPATDGTTGEEWITRLESKGFYAGLYAEGVLLSPDFRPTKGITTEVAVLKGVLFDDQSRRISQIRAYVEAFRTPDNRELEKPSVELACLIRENFTDEEIESTGLSHIVTMHEPVSHPIGVIPTLLYSSRGPDGGLLGARDGRPRSWWHRSSGFAFAVL